jgi:Pathogenicity locus
MISEMSKTPLTVIPGIGKTLAKDFARIDMHCVEDFQHKQADAVFEALAIANQQDNYKTSKNYLYVIRMAIYYAGGGRDVDKLKWSFWKD